MQILYRIMWKLHLWFGIEKIDQQMIHLPIVVCEYFPSDVSNQDLEKSFHIWQFIQKSIVYLKNHCWRSTILSDWIRFLEMSKPIINISLSSQSFLIFNFLFLFLDTAGGIGQFISAETNKPMAWNDAPFHNKFTGNEARNPSPCNNLQSHQQ